MAAPPVPSRPGTADRRAARASAQGRLRLELLAQLVRKDLKTKYQGSTLGFVWSLANPLTQVALYYVVFTYVLPNGIPDYHVYLMSGLLAFTAFSAGVSSASGSVLGNAGLVKKVRFPLLVLPLSSVAFALVQLALQLPVLLLVVLLSGRNPFHPDLLLAVPALVLLAVFSCALGILVSALSVRYRDTAHFVEMALLVWFWANPIVYAGHQVRDRLDPHGLFWVYFLNPVATVVTCLQRAVYQTAPYVTATGERRLLLVDAGYGLYLRNLALGFLVAGVLLAVALRTFGRYQADFAEQL